MFQEALFLISHPPRLFQIRLGFTIPPEELDIIKTGAGNYSKIFMFDLPGVTIAPINFILHNEIRDELIKVAKIVIRKVFKHLAVYPTRWFDLAKFQPLGGLLFYLILCEGIQWSYVCHRQVNGSSRPCALPANFPGVYWV